MRLPKADEAIIELEKVTSCLLNPVHRYGASKARFFQAFGLAEQLRSALHEHAKENEVIRTRDMGFGRRYEVHGRLNCPDGRRPLVRSVWQIEEGDIAPRLITAYPSEAK
jgi:hypothetical protein